MALLRALRAAGLASPAAEAVLSEGGFTTIADLAYISAQDAAEIGLAAQHAWAASQRDSVATAARVKGLAVVRLENATIQREARDAKAQRTRPGTSASSTTSPPDRSQHGCPPPPPPSVRRRSSTAMPPPRSRTPLRRRRGDRATAAHRHDADVREDVIQKVICAAVLHYPPCQGQEERIRAETARLEVTTVSSRLAVIAKFAAEVDRASIPIDAISTNFISEYIDKVKGMDMPIHTWYAIRWWSRILGVAWHMPRVPVRRMKDGEFREEEQAVAADPELIARLEMAAGHLADRKDWRLGAVLGAILMTTACLRFRHCQRSAFTVITGSLICGRCYRGKAQVRGVRPAFEWRAPVRTLTGIPCMQMLWERWNAKAKLHDGGLNSIILDYSSGQILSLAAFHEAIRSVAVDFRLTESPACMSSYSFRRFQPTIADIRMATHEEKMAIGGWRERVGGVTSLERGTPRASTMPARYADRKAETEASVKALQIEMVRRCLQEMRAQGTEPLTWEAFRLWCAGVAPGCVDQMRTEAAAASILKRSDIGVAVGAESVAERIRARSFSFAAHKLTKAEPNHVVADRGSADAEAGVGSAQSPAPDLRVRWIRSLLPNRKWHFESHQSWLPLCSIKGGRAVPEPREAGVDLRVALAGGAPCDKCVAQLSPSLRRAVDKAINSSDGGL